jgi:hypothetical protein
VWVTSNVPARAASARHEAVRTSPAAAAFIIERRLSMVFLLSGPKRRIRGMGGFYGIRAHNGNQLGAIHA